MSSRTYKVVPHALFVAFYLNYNYPGPMPRREDSYAHGTLTRRFYDAETDELVAYETVENGRKVHRILMAETPQPEPEGAIA